MTTATAHPASDHTDLPELPTLARTRLIVALLSHGAVDFFSFMVIPLVSVLEGRLGLSPGQGALLVSVGVLSSGLAQPVAALIADRFNTRVVGTLGFLIAVVAISSIGRVRSFEQLLVLQIIGTAGIGAFHPIAAATIGQLAGRKRSLIVSIFFVCGMSGGIVGSNVAPVWAARLGMESMVVLIVPGVVAVAALAWAIHGVPHRSPRAHAEHAALSPQDRRLRWRVLGVLYVATAMRFTVNNALMMLVIRWSERLVLTRAGATVLSDPLRDEASLVNGPMQSAMLIGMAAGGLAMGLLVGPRLERRALLWCPLFGAAAIVGFAFAPTLTGVLPGPNALLIGAFPLAVLMGMGYAGLVPVGVSLAQRLLPHRTGLASGVMLGGAWAVGMLGPIGAQAMLGEFSLQTTMLVGAGVLALSSPLALLIPRRVLAQITPG